jgi:hypothetical protein
MRSFRYLLVDFIQDQNEGDSLAFISSTISIIKNLYSPCSFAAGGMKFENNSKRYSFKLRRKSRPLRAVFACIKVISTPKVKGRISSIQIRSKIIDVNLPLGILLAIFSYLLRVSKSISLPSDCGYSFISLRMTCQRIKPAVQDNFYHYIPFKHY